MRRTLISLATVGALAVILTGCAGASSAPTPSTGVDLPAATEPTSTSVPAPTETLPPVATETPEQLVTDPPAAEVVVPVNPGLFMDMSETGGDGVDFVSPSRNIVCTIFEAGTDWDFWGCKAKEFTFDPGPRPSEHCHMVGSVEGVGDDPVKFGCRTDEPFRGTYDDTVAVLDYGKSITFGGVVCVSREDGMTCDRASSGHGFDISRTEANLW
ncbi:DUF6636 domain-containing protein [Leifsonia sp. Leaf264]|uniref:DUF6636 domain-containing protein n=1 Tax=Leifsonia sp. Leaf264 TaxID=1736314 RepID=UPI0006FB7E5D|nr:DUF6636 domain-containing protein [Leifsonia sp. Leaf264]KQO98924.1 hypothetical protein ASF30_12760 [Leifsonia sp. Leaf264]